MTRASCRSVGELVEERLFRGRERTAAEQVGRRAFCIEIDPRYVDVAVRRWQLATRKDAILEATGRTFDEVLAARTSPPRSKAKGRR